MNGHKQTWSRVTNPLQIQLNMLKLKHSVDYNLIQMTYKAYNGQLPLNVQNLFKHG